MLIGRAADLDVCLRQVEEGRPLAILGVAGIGKTALIREIAARCKRRTFVGQGLRTLSWVSYLGLEAALRTKMPSGDHAWVAHAVERRLADGVLVLDDLQWADDDTLAVVPYLAPRIRMLVAVRVDDSRAERARSTLAEAHVQILQLRPLSDGDSDALLRTRHRELTLLERRKVIRRAEGNPLLLEELSWGGTQSNSLEVSIAARLQQLSGQSQRALSVLALLDRPAGRELTGPGLRELVRAGLAIQTRHGFAVRHALIAQAAADRLSEGERCQLHAKIAAKVTNAGEAAVHHELAGNLHAARREALRAAESTPHIGQRARLLLIAARSGGDSASDDHLRLRAAEALVEAGEYHDAGCIASAVGTSKPDVAAKALLLRARALRGMEGLSAGQGLVRKALQLVSGSRSLVEIWLRLEQITIWTWEWNDAAAVPAARETLAMASGGPAEIAASIALGTALCEAGDRESLRYLRRALSAARRQRDSSAECDAEMALAFSQRMFGDWQGSLETARTMRKRALRTGLRSREVAAMSYEMEILVDCAGDLDRGIQMGPELLDDPALPSRLRQDIFGELALALLEAGRVDDAWDVLRRSAPDEMQESVFPAIAWAECELDAGRARRSIEIVHDAVGRFPNDPNLPLLWVTKGWACRALDREVEPLPSPLPFWSSACRVELEALRALDSGDHERAERAFEEASRLAHDFDLRTELRCLWAAGAAAAEAGNQERAKQRLVEVEQRAIELGMNRLLAKIHSSLRLIGVRRATPRSQRVGPLTGREREVLRLVANGQRTREISARLGIGRATVDSLVRSAMTKLDARTRIEAAQRAASLGAIEP